MNTPAKLGLYAMLDYHQRTAIYPYGIFAKSSLRSPVVRVEDHKSEVLSCNFNSAGNLFLSSNQAGEIHMCATDGGDKKMMRIPGHSGPVMETHFSKDETDIISCSVDKTLGIWDSSMGARILTLQGHTSNVNSVQRSRMQYPLLCSGSNDKTVRIWDTREGKSLIMLRNGAEVNATCFNENSEQVFSAGNDNVIKIWDLRMTGVISRLQGHTGPVTGLSLSPCGEYLLSHGLDATLRVWDVRPYASPDRFKTGFHSNQYFVDGLLRCAWSPNGKMVSAGTADRHVFIWDANTGERLRAFPGHQSCVNDIAFHPTEPIILSAANDNYVYLNEI